MRAAATRGSSCSQRVGCRADADDHGTHVAKNRSKNQSLKGARALIPSDCLAPVPAQTPGLLLLSSRCSRARRSSCASSLIRRMGLRDLRNKPYSKPKRLLLSSPLAEPNVYGPLDPVNKYDE